MSAKTSKEVTDRQRSCRFLMTAFERQGGEIVARLGDSVRPWLAEDEIRPDFGSTVHGLGRWLGASIDHLVTLDQEVYEKKAHLAEARKERDRVVTQLAREVSRLRLSIENQYEAPQLASLGFEAPTPRVAAPLVRQAERLVESLGKPGLAALLGAATYEQPFDPGTHREALKARCDAAGRQLLQVDRLRRDVDRASVHRRRALAEHDGLFLQTARNFETLCRMADEPELAERVRPSLRKPGRVENPDLGALEGLVDGAEEVGPGKRESGSQAGESAALFGPDGPSNENQLPREEAALVG